jgi:putative tryptophan/tyrosine transport system substrate-binding protein
VRRRELLLAGTAITWPLVARAEQPKVPTVGVLVIPDYQLPLFRQGLRDLGYVEGQTIRLEIRSANGDLQRLGELAAELVRLKVDVLVAVLTPAVLAAQHATSETPIVMLGVGDPVGMGIVASLARPGGNITGTEGLPAPQAAKNLELLKEVLPSLRRIAALCNAPDPYTTPFLTQIQRAGDALKIEVVPLMVKAGPELDAAFPAMVANKVEAVIVQSSLPLKHVADLAIEYRLPAAANFLDFATNGGLMAYGAKPGNAERGAAVFVDKILKGAKPADLPVEQPTTFELVINLKTATALGLTVPQSLLARADEVIE